MTTIVEQVRNWDTEYISDLKEMWSNLNACRDRINIFIDCFNKIPFTSEARIITIKDAYKDLDGVLEPELQETMKQFLEAVEELERIDGISIRKVNEIGFWSLTVGSMVMWCDGIPIALGYTDRVKKARNMNLNVVSVDMHGIALFEWGETSPI